MAQVAWIGGSQPRSDNPKQHHWPSVMTCLQQAQLKKKIQHPVGFQVGSIDPATLSMIPEHLHWDHTETSPPTQPPFCD